MPEWSLFCAGGLGGFLVGGIPTGVILSRRKYRIDVREMGSGNIGATNVTRVFGWSAGLLTLVFDFFKGFLPLFLLRPLFPHNPWLLTVVGSALVLGHCFSPYLRFKGGKGVATSFGCLSVFAPWAALAAAGAYGLGTYFSKISAVGSMAGLLATLGYLLWARPEAPVAVLISVFSFLILVRHKHNLLRLLRGEPASYR